MNEDRETTGFMYIKLYLENEWNASSAPRMVAQVTREGSSRPSVGTENSRACSDPIAVFSIDDFRGLGVIKTEILWDEILRRMEPDKIMERIGRKLEIEDLLDILNERLGRG